MIPNALTVTRILIAGLFPSSTLSKRPTLMIIALLTEFFDGASSRWLKAQTLLGQYLDPIADKLFFGAVSFAYVRSRQLKVREVLLLGFRDIFVSLAVLAFALEGKQNRYKAMKPQFFGKLATSLQYAAFFSLLWRGRVGNLLTGLTAISGILASIQYFRAQQNFSQNSPVVLLFSQENCK